MKYPIGFECESCGHKREEGEPYAKSKCRKCYVNESSRTRGATERARYRELRRKHPEREVEGAIAFLRQLDRESKGDVR